MYQKRIQLVKQIFNYIKMIFKETLFLWCDSTGVTPENNSVTP